jgi:hypothetical protein
VAVAVATRAAKARRRRPWARWREAKQTVAERRVARARARGEGGAEGRPEMRQAKAAAARTRAKVREMATAS